MLFLDQVCFRCKIIFEKGFTERFNKVSKISAWYTAAGVFTWLSQKWILLAVVANTPNTKTITEAGVLVELLVIVLVVGTTSFDGRT